MIALVLIASFAADASLSADARAAAARAEADAFAAVESHRDCDAAAAFLQAFEIARDERLLLNAALAFEKAGDFVAAREAYRTVANESLATRARARLRALDETSRPQHRCAARVSAAATIAQVEAPAAPQVEEADVERDRAHRADFADADDSSPPSPSSPSSSSSSSSQGSLSTPLFGVGIGALVGGVVIGGGTAGAFALQQGVLHDADSSGSAKSTALGASYALIAGGSVAAALVAVGGVLLPMSLMPSSGAE